MSVQAGFSQKNVHTWIYTLKYKTTLTLIFTLVLTVVYTNIHNYLIASNMKGKHS